MATPNVAQVRLCILLFHSFTHSLFFINTPFIQCLFRRTFWYFCGNRLFQHLIGNLQTIEKIPTTRFLLFIRPLTPQVRSIHHVITASLISSIASMITSVNCSRPHGSNSLLSIAFTSIGREVAANSNDDEKARTKKLLTRKNLPLALQTIVQVGQTEITNMLGISDSTVSRIKSERLEKVIKVLAACDLKVVPKNYHGDHAEFIDAALVLSYCGIKAVRKDQRLLI
jgi:predicted XRE-type DNA-binding protein